MLIPLKDILKETIATVDELFCHHYSCYTMNLNQFDVAAPKHFWLQRFLHSELQPTSICLPVFSNNSFTVSPLISSDCFSFNAK